MKLIKLVLFVVVIFLGVSFACLNATKVAINLYIGTYELYLSVLLVMTLGLGIFIGFIAMCGSYLRLKADNYKIRSKAKLVEKEISNLRAMPIKDVN